MSEIENKKKLDTVQSEEPNRKSTREVPMKLNLGYAVGEISDMIAYQGFSFLIFTFYSVVIGLSVNIVTIVYIIWSIYNAFNDPVLGALSDRTKTTRFGGGRRRPWIIAMLFPLSLCMFFLFTPPMPSISRNVSNG
jgi:GPH family glycoside/pentoside/hexuronide:cation symporter